MRELKINTLYNEGEVVESEKERKSYHEKRECVPLNGKSTTYVTELIGRSSFTIWFILRP